MFYYSRGVNKLLVHTRHHMDITRFAPVRHGTLFIGNMKMRGDRMDKRTSILVVDDLLEIQKLIRLILDRYAVATVSGAEEAFVYMASNPVDVVLLDINMPKMDGITALEEMKKRHPEIKVIMISADATIDKVRQVMRLGAFGFLMKPFDNDELVKIVNEALSNNGSIKSSEGTP